LVRDVAYGQIPRAARADKHIRAAGWIESLARTNDHAELLAHHYLSALELARAANQDIAALVPRARAALHAAGDRASAVNALPSAARYYRGALALWPEDAQQPQAGLLRLLGTVLVEAGDLSGAEAVLAEGAQAATAAGLPAVRARIGVWLAAVHTLQGRGFTETAAECEAATAVLEAEGDLEGLAEAWLWLGRLRLWFGDSPADRQAFEKAIAYAAQSGSHRAQMQASGWLVLAFSALPIPADLAIARGEQLLQTASGDPWAEAEILAPLSQLYAYAGRFADARAAVARAQSVYGRSGAKLEWAVTTSSRAGQIELIAGNPAAAERYLREGCELLRSIGERAFLCAALARLAEAVYLQGRLDEAQQLTDEARSAAPADDYNSQARWRATAAKLLARRGQSLAARRLADEAVALVPETSYAALLAQTLIAKAEVDQLAGARHEAADSLRAALRIYEDRRAVPLADQARTLVARLEIEPDTRPAS